MTIQVASTIRNWMFLTINSLYEFEGSSIAATATHLDTHQTNSIRSRFKHLSTSYPPIHTLSN